MAAAGVWSISAALSPSLTAPARQRNSRRFRPGVFFCAATFAILRLNPAHVGRATELWCSPLTPFAKDNRMKMYPDDWQVRLTTGVVTAICIVAAWLLGLGPEAGLWPFMLSIIVAIIIGNLLGRLVYRLLFQRSSSGSPDHPPRA